MRRLQNFLMLLALGSVFFVSSSTAHACTCGEQTVSEQRQNASVVFAGTVKSKVRSNAVERDGVQVTIKVTRVWKGNVGREITIYTGPTADIYTFENLCAPPLKVGASYLVFAVGKEKFATDVCAGTVLLAEAKTTIQQLGPSKRIAQAAKSKG